VGVITKDSTGLVIEQIEYTYDVYDRRITKSVDTDGNGVKLAEVERYVHDGENLALVFDGNGNLTERFLYGVVVDQVLAQDKGNGAVLWGLADNQGSIRLVTDNNGNVVNEITYDAFGNVVLESNGNVEFRFGYTGRELDAETGDYYYRSRYYDSTIGRFVSEDTIGFEGGDANLYRYVGNGSTNYIDPFGYFIVASPRVPPTLPRALPRHVPTVPSQPYFNPYRPSQVPSGYPIPDYSNNHPQSKPYDYSRTCISALGVPCIPNEPIGEWAAEMMRIVAENTQKQDLEDSCPAVYPYNNPNNNDNDDNNRRELYRGDSRTPDEIFESGFRPRGTNTDIEKYVRNNEPSIYVGTSKKFSVGAGFATNKGRHPGFVYVVLDPGGGIDVNKEFRRITGEGSPFFREQEVAFPGGISTQDIRGAVPIGKDLNPTGLEIPNPYYRKR
jgi:RHS repeat-associated protein